MNSHNWYGVLSTLNHSFSNALKLIAGVDLKYYRGLHFSKIDDLLGGAYYIDKTNYNTNFGKNGYKAVVGDKDGWDYDGIVSWAGLFTQLEYSVGKLSVFGALSASYSQYTREDRFNYFVDEATREAIASSITWPTTGTTTYIGSLPYTSKADFIAKNPVGTTSEKKVFIGYSAKGGANYNIDANHNIFANIGYFSKPPLMSNIFVRNRNEIAQDIKPEYNFAAEGGYGFRSKNFTVNLNVYYTYWMNKAFQTTLTTAGVSTTSNINGQNAIHKGIELEVFTSPMKGLTVNLMGSLGDWRWEGNATGDLYDANNVLLKSYTVFADGLKVGNAAQFTSTVGLDYRFGFGLGVNLDYNYFGENYASFFPNNRQPFVSGGVTYTDLQQPARIPAYGLFDLGLSYKVNIYKSISTVLRVSVNNLLDHSYIADATDKGVLNSTTGEFVHDVYANTGYYGFGRNWNISLKINF